MKLIDIILRKAGIIRLSTLRAQLNFARSVGKRLDEHREVVENISQETSFFDKKWNAGHMATQDDYLIRLYFIVHGEYPQNTINTLNDQNEFVRKRPAILGDCKLPEFTSETN